MSLARRDFLQWGVAGLAGLHLPATDCNSLGAEPQRHPFPIIDSHTHFYDPNRPQGVPWPSRDDPILFRTVLPPEFQALTSPLGVTGTIIVEASPWVEDNQWLLDLAASNPFILGIVGHLSPGTEAFAAQIDRFKKNALYRGIRIGSGALKEGMERPEFQADLRRLVDANLELDVNGGPELLPFVHRLAGQLPQLRIVINHLANVKIDGKAPPAAWRTDLKATAKHRNVFLKVSALIENAHEGHQKAPKDQSFYAPILQAVWEIFGEDRLIYGSNWPVSELAGDYGLVFRIVSQFFDQQGHAAREKFFARNAQVAYALPTRK